MLPTYQNAGEGENLLVPTTVEQPEVEEVPQSGWNRKNLARVATVLMVCFIVAAFALRTQVTTSPTLGSVNSPISKTNNIMRSSGSNVDKPVQPLSDIRSDSRLSPLFMSSHIDTEGLLRTFFSKYGLVGNRQTSKDKYEVPTDIQSTSEVKGDAATWAYATMYSGATCQGTTISKAGLAGQQCIPVAGFGSSSTSQAFSIDCSSGQVVLNAYTAQDCSGPVSSSSVLASSGTCYQYSSTMYENPTDSPVLDSSSSTSVIFTCGTPDLSGYDVEKVRLFYTRTNLTFFFNSIRYLIFLWSCSCPCAYRTCRSRCSSLPMIPLLPFVRLPPAVHTMVKCSRYIERHVFLI